jgi:glutamine amidotransferase
MPIGLIDYQVNNLKSISSALSRLDIEYEILSSSQDLSKFEKIILPGVGSFSAGMESLNLGGWTEEIRNSVENGSKLLGICLGMQLLFEKSFEFTESIGLGLIEGSVRSFENRIEYPVPHTGWNSIEKKKDHQIFLNINNDIDFYFVHSFYCNPVDRKVIAATTNYAIEFPSVVLNNNILGVQFHPEKSFPGGSKLLQNFANW